jgi:hypothetical protein
MKLYYIENNFERGCDNKPHYRFVSKYNGTKGPWRAIAIKAQADGQEHEEIVLMLHNQKRYEMHIPEGFKIHLGKFEEEGVKND